MIRLFDATDTDFSSNGNLTIKPYKLVETKKKSLNGWYIDVEIDIKYREHIDQDVLCVIKTKSKTNLQAFRISNIKQTTNKVVFQAHHVMYDAERYFLLDVRPTNMSAIAALTYTNDRTDKNSPFSYLSNVSNMATAYFIRKTLFEAWKIIEERWVGVFDADNFVVSFKTDTPIDKGETLQYGVDLQGIEVYENWSSVVTKLYPTSWEGLMLPEVFLESEQQYEEPYTRTVHFETDLEEEEKTEENLIEELRSKAIEYLEVNQFPQVSYTVKSDVRQDLEINDLVSVKHPYLTLYTSVQEYTFNVLTNRVVTLTFGNYSRDAKKRFTEIKEGIQEIGQKLNKVEELTANQTNLINNLNKNGFVYIDENEILILDKLPRESARDVWRFGLGGLGFSSHGYEGPFEYAFTQDGKFNASFIVAGSIVTNMLSADVGSALDISSNTSIKLIAQNIKSVEQEIENIELTPGPQGPPGKDGAQGLKGDQGIPGTKGTDGLSQYTHIRYSTSANGNPMTTTPDANTKYIGIAVTTSATAPSGYASYSWAKFVGEDGEDGQDGIPGTPGADGITYYTWIKYADSPTTGMSNSPSGKAYIGIAHNQTTATESSVYSDYSWSLIKGDKGDKGDQGIQGIQGIPGQKGADGQTTYTWLKYADTPTSGMSDLPTGKKYMGIAVNKTTATESTNYSDYTWSKVEGDQGIQGPKGADGQPTYTWVKYADTPTTGMSNTATDKKYIGLAFNKTTPTMSTNYSDYAWSLMPQNITVGGRNLVRSDFVINPRSNDTNGFISNSWAGNFIAHQELVKMLKPDTEYFITYKFRLDSLSPNTTPFNQNAHGTLVIHSGVVGYHGIALRENVDTRVEASEWEVGSIVQRTAVFRTPVNLHDIASNYRIISYTRRSMNGDNLVKVEDGTFFDFAIYEGNAVQSWSPAPEDIENEIKRVETETKANISLNTEQIELEKSSRETQIGTIQDTVTEQSNRLTMLDNQFQVEVSERVEMGDTILSEASTLLEQTTNQFNFQFANLVEQITQLDDDTKTHFEELIKYIRFIDGNIVLGVVGNDLTLRISNDRIAFLQNNTEVAYFSNNQMFVKDGTFLNTLRLGNFAFTPRDNGNLSFRKEFDT